MNEDDRPTRYRIGQSASQITSFTGSRVPSIITDYIQDVTDRFEGTYEDQRILISMSMKGTARTWLNKLKETPEWSKMDGETVLALLKEAFYPTNYADAALNSLCRIVRKDRSLEAYLVEFTRLLQEIPTEAYNETLARVCLINGVGEPYAAELRRQNFKTYHESFDYLQRQVNTLTTLPGADSVHWPHPDSMEIDHVSTTAPAAATPASALVGVDLALLSKAEVSAINAEAAASSVCWYCKQLGHLMRDCRRRQNDRRQQRAADASKKE